MIMKFQDALDNGNVVVATLSNLFNDESHTVLIEKFEDYKFIVKDSHGENPSYEIPFDRPDSIQVFKLIYQNFFNMLLNNNLLGQNHATC